MLGFLRGKKKEAPAEADANSRAFFAGNAYASSPQPPPSPMLGQQPQPMSGPQSPQSMQRVPQPFGFQPQPQPGYPQQPQHQRVSAPPTPQLSSTPYMQPQQMYQQPPIQDAQSQSQYQSQPQQYQPQPQSQSQYQYQYQAPVAPSAPAVLTPGGRSLPMPSRPASNLPPPPGSGMLSSRSPASSGAAPLSPQVQQQMQQQQNAAARFMQAQTAQTASGLNAPGSRRSKWDVIRTRGMEEVRKDIQRRRATQTRHPNLFILVAADKRRKMLTNRMNIILRTLPIAKEKKFEAECAVLRYKLDKYIDVLVIPSFRNLVYHFNKRMLDPNRNPLECGSICQVVEDLVYKRIHRQELFASVYLSNILTCVYSGLMTGLESVQIRFLRILTAIFALEKKYVQPHVGCILQAVIPLVYQRPSPGSTASNLAELGLPPGTTVSGLADEVSRSLNKICNDRLYYFVFDLFYHPDNRIKKWALRFFITNWNMMTVFVDSSSLTKPTKEQEQQAALLTMMAGPSARNFALMGSPMIGHAGSGSMDLMSHSDLSADFNPSGSSAPMILNRDGSAAISAQQQMMQQQQQQQQQLDPSLEQGGEEGLFLGRSMSAPVFLPDMFGQNGSSGSSSADDEIIPNTKDKIFPGGPDRFFAALENVIRAENPSLFPMVAELFKKRINFLSIPITPTPLTPEEERAEEERKKKQQEDAEKLLQQQQSKPSAAAKLVKILGTSNSNGGKKKISLSERVKAQMAIEAAGVTAPSSSPSSGGASGEAKGMAFLRKKFGKLGSSGADGAESEEAQKKRTEEEEKQRLTMARDVGARILKILVELLVVCTDGDVIMSVLHLLENFCTVHNTFFIEYFTDLVTTDKAERITRVFFKILRSDQMSVYIYPHTFKGLLKRLVEAPLSSDMEVEVRDIFKYMCRNFTPIFFENLTQSIQSSDVLFVHDATMEFVLMAKYTPLYSLLQADFVKASLYMPINLGQLCFLHELKVICHDLISFLAPPSVIIPTAASSSSPASTGVAASVEAAAGDDEDYKPKLVALLCDWATGIADFLADKMSNDEKLPIGLKSAICHLLFEILQCTKQPTLDAAWMKKVLSWLTSLDTDAPRMCGSRTWDMMSLVYLNTRGRVSKVPGFEDAFWVIKNLKDATPEQQEIAVEAIVEVMEVDDSDMPLSFSNQEVDGEPFDPSKHMINDGRPRRRGPRLPTGSIAAAFTRRGCGMFCSVQRVMLLVLSHLCVYLNSTQLRQLAPVAWDCLVMSEEEEFYRREFGPKMYMTPELDTQTIQAAATVLVHCAEILPEFTSPHIIKGMYNDNPAIRTASLYRFSNLWSHRALLSRIYKSTYRDKAYTLKLPFYPTGINIIDLAGHVFEQRALFQAHSQAAMASSGALSPPPPLDVVWRPQQLDDSDPIVSTFKTNIFLPKLLCSIVLNVVDLCLDNYSEVHVCAKQTLSKCISDDPQLCMAIFINDMVDGNLQLAPAASASTPSASSYGSNSLASRHAASAASASSSSASNPTAEIERSSALLTRLSYLHQNVYQITPEYATLMTNFLIGLLVYSAEKRPDQLAAYMNAACPILCSLLKLVDNFSLVAMQGTPADWLVSGRSHIHVIQNPSSLPSSALPSTPSLSALNLPPSLSSAPLPSEPAPVAAPVAPSPAFGSPYFNPSNQVFSSSSSGGGQSTPSLAPAATPLIPTVVDQQIPSLSRSQSLSVNGSAAAGGSGSGSGKAPSSSLPAGSPDSDQVFSSQDLMVFGSRALFYEHIVRKYGGEAAPIQDAAIELLTQVLPSLKASSDSTFLSSSSSEQDIQVRIGTRQTVIRTWLRFFLVMFESLHDADAQSLDRLLHGICSILLDNLSNVQVVREAFCIFVRAALQFPTFFQSQDGFNVIVPAILVVYHHAMTDNNQAVKEATEWTWRALNSLHGDVIMMLQITPTLAPSNYAHDPWSPVRRLLQSHCAPSTFNSSSNANGIEGLIPQLLGDLLKSMATPKAEDPIGTASACQLRGITIPQEAVYSLDSYICLLANTVTASPLAPFNSKLLEMLRFLLPRVERFETVENSLYQLFSILSVERSTSELASPILAVTGTALGKGNVRQGITGAVVSGNAPLHTAIPVETKIEIINILSQVAHLQPDFHNAACGAVYGCIDSLLNNAAATGGDVENFSSVRMNAPIMQRICEYITKGLMTMPLVALNNVNNSNPSASSSSSDPFAYTPPPPSKEEAVLIGRRHLNAALSILLPVLSLIIKNRTAFDSTAVLLDAMQTLVARHPFVAPIFAHHSPLMIFASLKLTNPSSKTRDSLCRLLAEILFQYQDDDETDALPALIAWIQSSAASQNAAMAAASGSKKAAPSVSASSISLPVSAYRIRDILKSQLLSCASLGEYRQTLKQIVIPTSLFFGRKTRCHTSAELLTVAHWGILMEFVVRGFSFVDIAGDSVSFKPLTSGGGLQVPTSPTKATVSGPLQQQSLMQAGTPLINPQIFVPQLLMGLKAALIHGHSYVERQFPNMARFLFVDHALGPSATGAHPPQYTAILLSFVEFVALSRTCFYPHVVVHIQKIVKNYATMASGQSEQVRELLRAIERACDSHNVATGRVSLDTLEERLIAEYETMM